MLTSFQEDFEVCLRVSLFEGRKRFLFGITLSYSQVLANTHSVWIQLNDMHSEPVAVSGGRTTRSG